MLRDNARYAMARLLLPIRRLYLEFGRRWTERGWLRAPEDVFFFTVAELEGLVKGGAEKVSASELQARVADRRRAYGYWLTVIPAETIGPDLVPLARDGQPIIVDGGTGQVFIDTEAAAA